MYLKEIKIKGFLFVFWNLVWSILDLAIWKWAQWLLENHCFLNVIWHSQGGEKDRRGGKKRVKITLKPSYGECILLYWAHSENTWCLVLFIQALDIACDIFHVFGMTWWVLLCFKNILSYYYIKVKIWYSHARKVVIGFTWSKLKTIYGCLHWRGNVTWTSAFSSFVWIIPSLTLPFCRRKD